MLRVNYVLSGISKLLIYIFKAQENKGFDISPESPPTQEAPPSFDSLQNGSPPPKYPDGSSSSLEKPEKGIENVRSANQNIYYR